MPHDKGWPDASGTQIPPAVPPLPSGPVFMGGVTLVTTKYAMDSASRTAAVTAITLPPVRLVMLVVSPDSGLQAALQLLRPATPQDSGCRQDADVGGASGTGTRLGRLALRTWSANIVTASSMRRMYRSPPGSLASCWLTRPTTRAVQRWKGASSRGPARLRMTRPLARTSTAIA